jgi:hypothetical protein
MREMRPMFDRAWRDSANIGSGTQRRYCDSTVA